MYNEGGLLLMTIFDVDVVASPMNVKLSEMSSIFQFVYEIRDQRQRVDVMSGVFVEISIILAETKFFILFDEEEGGWYYNLPLFFYFPDLSFLFPQLLILPTSFAH